MENKNACIITEHGADIGMGHLIRCFALAEALIYFKVNPIFILNKPFAFTNSKFRHLTYKDEDNLLDILLTKFSQETIIIIDSYLLSQDFYNKVFRYFPKLVSIDDYERIDYPGGAVVNPAIYADELYKKRKESIQYYLGSKYALLRPQFWNLPQKSYPLEAKEILIILGGTDIRGLTLPILTYLDNNISAKKINVVVTDAYPQKKEIKEYIENNNGRRNNLLLHLNPDNMAEIMWRADLAITAGGQTTYELAATGTPAIGICVAGNQKLNVQYLSAKGILLNAGDYCTQNLEDKVLKCIIDLENNFVLRKEMGQKAQTMVNAKGAIKLVNDLLKWGKTYV
ncbi:UDP-2,4-diacetamido-2,4,6-trideoxy-beta-L-altropyranose hydrolase [Carboxydothermus pertinax]|uniref:Pseudaminic acid biosynthesis-associated protein PseG n=1 Tax=Carboxydothermus pertinax TaxID=870242 RepID=A0A1L8CUH3_9THEO|nr:UDP-2,4-diacetamido-2,4,6-trideoxy-beta-L-altropyranose hydrolase [Carboxydothermus pertinax]GAV22547.1 pseudaminic acid biosynthesis-associated protein PseG [Carboxydothermus pertinax]